MPGVLLCLVCLDWRLALVMMVGSTLYKPKPKPDDDHVWWLHVFDCDSTVMHESCAPRGPYQKPAPQQPAPARCTAPVPAQKMPASPRENSTGAGVGADIGAVC
jgi:hypothetical protein